MLDAQTEPDLLLRFAHDRVGDRGRCIGLAFGQTTVEKSAEQIERWGLPNVQLIIGHPALPIELKDEICHGAILRHTYGVPRLSSPFGSLNRLTKPGGRVLVRHTEWTVKLPKITEEEQEMVDALRAPGVKDGQDFFNQFEQFPSRKWREIRYDVYAIASRDPRAPVRHDYDWRRMLREQLGRARIFTPRQILDLIERLETTRGAKVSVDRYLALAIKP
jgi:hypothetical protein